MKIGSVRAIDPGFTSAQDSIRIQAENLQVIRAVRAINTSGNLGDSHELVFLLDRETRRPIIRIVNRITNEVVREISNNRVVQLAQDLKISE